MVRRTAQRLFSRLTPSTERTFGEILGNERVGGVLMLLGTVIALVWANSQWGGLYETIRDYVPVHSEVPLWGDETLHLDLSLATWAKDGLLAIFFFVIGLELKREIVAGELRKPSTAIVPIVAAIGGMVVPAGLYVLVNATSADGALHGWAVPTATDIAFALAVVSVVGRRLPTALRAFLLTLAVVDDLLAIIIIAVFYSKGFSLTWLLVSVILLAIFAVLVQRRVSSPWLLVPLALGTWLAMHESGVHATIAGVALGMVVPATRRPGEDHTMVEDWEHKWNPVSSGFAVPIFAFFAAGVAMDGEALRLIAADPASQGIALGLVVGKPVGIVLATFLVANLTRASLDRGLSWWDVIAVSFVAGIGFTVSLLISELAFETGDARAEIAKAAVLLASAIAAVIGAGLLFWRDRVYKGLYERRSHPVGDADGDDRTDPGYVDAPADGAGAENSVTPPRRD